MLWSEIVFAVFIGAFALTILCALLALIIALFSKRDKSFNEGKSGKILFMLCLVGAISVIVTAVTGFASILIAICLD